MEADSEKTQDAIKEAKSEFWARFLGRNFLPVASFGVALFLANQMFPGHITDLVDNFLLMMLPILALLLAFYIKINLNRIQNDCCNKQ